jgi:hypothetical protein
MLNPKVGFALNTGRRQPNSVRSEKCPEADLSVGLGPQAPPTLLLFGVHCFPKGTGWAMPEQDCRFRSAKRSALVARVLLAVIFTAGVHPGLAQKSPPPKHLGILASWACPERLVPEMRLLLARVGRSRLG